MEVIREMNRAELVCRDLLVEGVSTKLHWHDNYEIVELISEPCDFLIDGQYFEAKPGDIVSIREREVHKFIFDKDEMVFRMLQFPVKLFLNMNFKIKPIKTHIKAGELDAVFGLRNKLDRLFEILHSEGKTAEAKDNPFSSTICKSICYLLMSHFPAEDKRILENSKREMFFKAVEFINSNYKDNINIDTVAGYMDISRNRLVRLFESYSGKPLKEYIDELRVYHANRLFSSDINISEVARQCGYSCVRTFNNVYKKQMGITPSEYIKQHKRMKKSGNS